MYYRVVMQHRQIVLAGKRVALCVMEEGDQPHFHRWLTEQPELRSLVDDPRVPTAEDQEKWFRRSRESDRQFFSLVTVPDGVLIGNAGYVDIDSAAKSAQFRITIGHPDHRGKGLGTEATKLLLDHGFETLGLRRVWLRVRADNAAARSMYEKAGFRSIREYPEENGHGPGIIMELLCK